MDRQGVVVHSIGIISVGRGVDQRRGPAVRGKGWLVHGTLETLTHTTQQVTTHSSEPHPQASGVVPSSHTMRWLLAVSCLSLSRASVPIPTSPITPAPQTRAPPTAVPLSPCVSVSFPPFVAFVKAPIPYEAYSECYTFLCVGTLEVTFRNISRMNARKILVLQNSDGYVLTSLAEAHPRYKATYPANGEMTVVFNDTWGSSYYGESEFTFDWECHTGPAVVPAAGFDASTYLTLPPVGTYERMISEKAISSWLIPCTGMLDIAATSGTHNYESEFIFMNSDGTILASHWEWTNFNGTFSVAGNFNITLRSERQEYYDFTFAFAWSCGGTRPDIPSHDLTPAPETRAPPTAVPRAACEALLSPPLDARFRAPIHAEYVVCWTFQCVGTVEVTFRNIHLTGSGETTLQNSDGYVLTSFMGKHERHIATYPANGEMMVVFNDSMGSSYYGEDRFTFGWVCHTGPAVVPAAGFDASTYLTLPPAGTYERMFSERAISSWLIPCTGMLDIAATYSTKWPVVIFTNSNGTSLRTDRRATWIFNVAGNFKITWHSTDDAYFRKDDTVFTFAWSCGGTRPDFPSHDLTPAPETPAPPTVVPRAPCEALLSPPLVATIKAPVQAEYVECWTFQCVGTVEVTFRNITSGYNARVTLQNSDGYVLTSFVENRERYIATYPANGEMTVLFNDTRGYSHDYYHMGFTLEWVCHTGPAVVPAAGFDASTYLTLPPAGTYERMFSEKAISSWLIPCTGMLDIAAYSFLGRSVEFGYMNSNGTILRTDSHSTSFNGRFNVAGNFNITLRPEYQYHGYSQDYDSKFAFAWSCGGTRPEFPSHDLTPAPETRAPPSAVPRAPCEALLSPPLVATIRAPVHRAEYVECWTFQCVGTVEVTFRNITLGYNARATLQNSDGYVLTSLFDNRERYIATYPANGEMTVVLKDTRGESKYIHMDFTFDWECHTGPAVVPAAGFDASTYLTLPPAGTYERMISVQLAISSWLIPCTGMLDIATSSFRRYGAEFGFRNSDGTILRTDRHSTSFNGTFSVAGNFIITLELPPELIFDAEFTFAWSCGGTRPDFPSHDLTPAPETNAPATTGLTNLPTAASTSSPPAPYSAAPPKLPALAVSPTPWSAGASHAPGTSAPDTALPTATPTDQPAGATFAPSAPAVKALCTADKDCRSGRLDPKATCNAGTCVCHTQGYVHPTGVPLCLLADDVTVSPQPEESGGSSNVVLYVGIGVGVLVVAVCVVAAFCCLQKKQRARDLENYDEMRYTEGDTEDTESEGGSELDLF